jgi:dolichyl-phosphate beta-glucosyltransferase
MQLVQVPVVKPVAPSVLISAASAVDQTRPIGSPGHPANPDMSPPATDPATDPATSPGASPLTGALTELKVAESSAGLTARPSGSLITTAPTLAIVIPMFNEANRIAATLGILAAGDLNRDDVQIILADDGSTDDSAVVALGAARSATFARPIDVLAGGDNQGKGAAVRRGVLAAAESGAAYIAFLDADLSLDPVVVDRCVEVMVRQQANIATGERIVDRRHQPRFRRAISLVFQAFTRSLAPTGVRDTQCACKVFTAEAARAVFEPLQTSGFAFDVEVLLRARMLGLHIVQVPVSWRHTDGSRVNPMIEPFRMARDVARMRRMLAASSPVSKQAPNQAPNQVPKQRFK